MLINSGITGKVIKKIVKTIVLAIVVLLTGLVTLFTILRSPSFQELAGRIAASYLSEKFQTEIYLEKVRINDFLNIELHGLHVKDNHAQNLLQVNEMQLKLEYISLREHDLYFDRISIDSGDFVIQWHQGDTMPNLNYFLERFGADTAAPGELPVPWEIRCKDLTVDDMSFSFRAQAPDTVSGINFNDLAFSNIFVNITDISIFGDSISAYIDHIAFVEKSGFELLNLSGDARVSQSGIKVEEAQISTGHSSLDLDLEFAYQGYNKLSWFLDSVNMTGVIRSSLVTLSDIGYFAPELMGMEDPVMFSGKVKGPVSDFTADDLEFSFGQFTTFKGSISMKGLPDFYSTFVKLQIEELNTTPADVNAFLLPLTNYVPVVPAQLENIGFTSIYGWYEGIPDRFTTSLDITTDAGSLMVEGGFGRNATDGTLSLSGSVAGEVVHLGNILMEEDFGTVNFDFEFDGEGPAFDEAVINITGGIHDFVYKDYQYSLIELDGRIKGKSYDGKIIVTDPAVAFELNGLADFNGEYLVLDLILDIEKARLFDLHLSDRSEDMNIKGKIDIEAKGIDPDLIEGTLDVYDLNYFENGTNYLLNKMEIVRSRANGQQDLLKLRSDFIDGDITGLFSVKSLVDHLIVFFLDKETDPETQQLLDQKPQDITFDFILKDLSTITGIFLPELSISQGTTIHGKFDSRNSIFEIAGAVDTISFSGIDLNDFRFSGSTTGDDFSLNMTVSELILLESDDIPSISLENISSGVITGNDSLKFELAWNNFSPLDPNNGSVKGFVKFTSLSEIDAGLYQAEAFFNNSAWRIGDNNHIKIDSTQIIVENFDITKENESLFIEGVLSHQPEDTLSVYFNKWSLENFNPFLTSKSLNLSGIINGRFGVFRNEEITNIFAGISISDFVVNDVLFGEAEVKTRWIESSQALALDVNIFSRGTSETPYKILSVNGFYMPFNETRNFDFDIAVQNLNISVLEPMLTSFSSHTDGFATGKLTLDGTLKEPLLLGRLKLQRAEMQVDYLNVIYSFSNEVVFTKDQIKFSELTVFDPNSNKAVLTGGLKHNYFKDMSLDLTIKPENFMALNLNRYQNEIFYGKAYATGIVRLYGPFDNIAIEVDAMTEKGTNVSIPINYSVDVSQNDFIVFTGNKDSANADGNKDVQVTGVSLDIAMNITREADIEIFLPGNLGNIRATGEGKLRLGVDYNGYLTLNGSYRIHTGLFVFSLEELVSRRFEIMEGSNISWTGDIYDAEVNIIARYRLRTSLEGLGISMIDPDAASQKVIVNTDIRMTGNLFNPELSFGITFPNMQEQTKQAVYAVLDTTDAGLMNQQAISLLVLGSFSSTGSGGATNPVNPAAIVSNSLSNMLSQISNDFNIGINYMPGDQVSDEQLEVALSTQLLDDRLVIDGNFDVTSNTSSSQQTSSIVGDINIEYKLTPDGRFRVKAFNRSNDLTLFNDYAPYTQGVGIFWRKDFNTLGELFRKYGQDTQQKQKK